jgi:hypothetical protein
MGVSSQLYWHSSKHLTEIISIQIDIMSLYVCLSFLVSILSLYIDGYNISKSSISLFTIGNSTTSQNARHGRYNTSLLNMAYERRILCSTNHVHCFSIDFNYKSACSSSCRIFIQCRRQCYMNIHSSSFVLCSHMTI